MEPTQQGEFARGWKLLLSATLGVGLGLSPLPFYTIGVFLAPLTQAFGWNTKQVLTALIGTTLGAIIGAPLAGMVADRFGVRRIALLSCLLYGCAWFLLMLNQGSLVLFNLSWAIIGFFGAGTLPLTWTRPINNRFIIHRGLALGIALFATGLFGAAAKLYAGYLIRHIGWRLAFGGIGLLPICISLPVALAFFHDVAPGAQASRPAASGKSFLQALADRRFWTLGLTLICTAFALGGPIPNLEKMMGTKGFSPTTATFIASFIGYGVVVGRIGGGWLLDKIWAPLVGFVLLACPAIALLTLGSTGNLSFSTAAGAVFLIGLATGSEYDLIAFMTAKYFGMRSYSAIYGVLYGFFTLGAGFAPSYFGQIFDQTGSYNSILRAAAPITAAGALLLLTLGRMPRQNTH